VQSVCLCLSCWQVEVSSAHPEADDAAALAPTAVAKAAHGTQQLLVASDTETLTAPNKLGSTIDATRHQQAQLQDAEAALPDQGQQVARLQQEAAVLQRETALARKCWQSDLCMSVAHLSCDCHP